MNIFLIGLGNPGKLYQNTRHNLGFMAVDELVKKWLANWEAVKKINGQVAKYLYSHQQTLWALKPTTYMNNSGLAVQQLSDFYHLPNTDLQIWLIHDDVDFPLGKIKIQPGGGSAGHKGVDSVKSQISNMAFTWDRVIRFRLGIGRPSAANQQNDHKIDQSITEKQPANVTPDIDTWVLSKFSRQEKLAVGKMLARCTAAVEMALGQDIHRAMNHFNQEE